MGFDLETPVRNFVDYVREMWALGTIPAYISLGIIAVFAFWVIWQAVRGWQRGFLKQLLHTAFSLVAVIIAYYATTFLWSKALSILDGHTVESILALFGVTLPENIGNALGIFDMQVIEYILLLPTGVIVMPFVFMVVFFVLNIVFKLLYVITAGILHIPYSQNKADDLLGFIVGMAEGVLVACMILLPFADVSSISTEAYHMMEEAREERDLPETDGEKFLLSYAVPLERNPVLKAINSMGGEKLLDSFASFEDGNGGMNLRDEYASMLKLTFLDFASLHDADWMQLSDHHKLAIEDIVDSIEDSRYKTEVLTEVLGCIGQLIGANGALGTNGASSDIVLALFSVFNGLEADELNDILIVFEEFYFHLSDEGILKSFENGDTESLVLMFTSVDADGKSNLTKMTDILKKNERTAMLSTQITKLSMSALSGIAGMDAEVEAKYESVKGSFTEALSAIDTSKPKEEQVSDMSATIKTSMADNGMNIESEVADEMAKYVIDNYSGKETLTEEEFNDALLYYYQAKKAYDESQGS